jgi:short-subunit dehydrogenase
VIDYNGKTAMVTGAASGIGRALAEALAERGARVLLVDRDEEKLDEATRAILGAQSVVVDLFDPAATTKLVASAFDQMGRIDLICSNAGVGRGGRGVVDESLDLSVTQLFEVNLFAAMRLAQAYAQKLAETGGRGRLMITASEHSLSLPKTAPPSRGMSLYAASKHAVLIVAEWMRAEFRVGKTPIDVHVLMPGMTYTALIARVLKNPADAPPEVGLIMPDRCAEIALRGIDLGLFYIPTHAHIPDHMRPRLEGVTAAVEALGLKRPT